VVRGFVENQEVWTTKEQTSKSDTHTPTTGKFAEWPLMVRRGESETSKDSVSFGLDCVTSDLLEPGLKLAVLS
jgi:hypothetical protein